MRNSDLYRMPDWFFTGLVSYMAEGWNAEVNDAVKDAALSGKYKRIGRLEGSQATYAGHAIWKYIADTYGKSVIPNVLYVSRVNKDVESGFMYVLGISLKDLLAEWEKSVMEKYKKDALEIEMPQEVLLKRKTRKKRVYYGLKIDPSGRYYSYVDNFKGKSRLFLYDSMTNKRKRIFRNGIKLDRPAQFLYPRTTWHPTGEILSYVYQEKGDVLLNFYELESGNTTTRRIFLMEDILDISYAKNGRQMTFSGVYKGQSDIYLYNIPGNTQKKITDDRFDDLSPIFVNNSKEIIFSSNRTSTDLKPEYKDIDTTALNLDLYSYKIGKGTTNFRQITETPLFNESQPVEYRNGEVYYLSDEAGTQNIYKTRFDSTISAIDTSIHYRFFYTKEEMSRFKRNVREFSSTGELGDEVFLYYQDGRYQLMGGDLTKDKTGESVQDEDESKTQDKEQFDRDYIQMDVVYIEDRSYMGEVNIYDYRFEDKKSTNLTYEKEVIVFDRLDEPSATASGEFVLPQQRNYNLSFFKDQSILQINNAFLNQQYQAYRPPYQNPGLGGMLMLGISDLFEDHKIYGGIRL